MGVPSEADARAGTIRALTAVMKTRRLLVALLVTGAFAIGGCRHTWDGAKADTRKAVQKTGQGVEKTGQKIEQAGDKK